MSNAIANTEEREDRTWRLNTWVAVAGLIVALISIAAATKAWVILPYRVEKVEQEQTQTAKDLREMREILIRIDEKVKKL